MPEHLWWHKPLRVIQTNLQIKDTALMNPAKIASEIEEMGANVLVTNVGGIYAWYDSDVKYHHINEYLPEAFDLLEGLIDECHKRGIQIVARYDFSKTDDHVLQERPEWFVRDSQNEPRSYGITRPGNWSILYTTCVNGGYRGDQVAVPVIKESLTRYAFDGVFLNAPQFEPCCCGACRKKYKETYGEDFPLPENVNLDKAEASKLYSKFYGMTAERELDWSIKCVNANIAELYKAIKEVNKDIPLILYYNPDTERLDLTMERADMICCESQNILSRGSKNIPEIWGPAASTKACCTADAPRPFGIIHSSPGMDWRHTGLPPAEYRFWMSQIPANGGYIWHSLTGFNDTITDKRLLRAVSDINQAIKKTEDEMFGAVSGAKTLLLWDGKEPCKNWVEAMNASGHQYDLYGEYQLTPKLLAKYKTVLLFQNDISKKTAEMISGYVKHGGNLLIESTRNLETFGELTGVEDEYYVSEYLAASYLTFEGHSPLQKGFDQTPIIPHRGEVAYCKPAPGARVLATLIPPFAPLDAVGAPPERASMNVKKTDIPLAVFSAHGKGKVLFLPFQLGMLIREFKLGEHYQLASNCLDLLLREAKPIATNCPNGVQVVLWQKADRSLVHLVNGIGQRPLTDNVPVHDIELRLPLPDGKHALSAVSRIAGEELSLTEENGSAVCILPRLEVWDMISIQWSSVKGN